MGIAIVSWGEYTYHLPSTDPVSVWHCPLEHLEWLPALKFPPSCDLKSVFSSYYKAYPLNPLFLLP